MDINKEKQKRNQISAGVTWVDSKLIFKDYKKRMWFGVCHYSLRVFNFFPYDFKKPTIGITTIIIEPEMDYCERAFECINFKCPLNRFDKGVFLDQFGEKSPFSLALPNDFGTKDLWFNEGKYMLFWGKLITYFNMQPEGGLLEYSEDEEKIIV